MLYFVDSPPQAGTTSHSDFTVTYTSGCAYPLVPMRVIRAEMAARRRYRRARARLEAALELIRWYGPRKPDWGPAPKRIVSGVPEAQPRVPLKRLVLPKVAARVKRERRPGWRRLRA